jgi:phosphate transport system substrate-binding protein
MKSMKLRSLIFPTLVFALIFGVNALCSADTLDAAFLTNSSPSNPTSSNLAAGGTPSPSVPVTSIEPTPGSKLSEALKQLAKANEGTVEELARLVAMFPTYSLSESACNGSLRIIGSDSLGPLLVRAVGSYKGIHPDAVIEVSQRGSMKGLDALQSGNCEMATVSRDLSVAEIARIEEATGKRVFTVPIALGAVCVYVNADNPIKGLSKAQCNGIFSIVHSMTADPIIRWKQLDPASPISSAAVLLYIEKKLSGTLRLFNDWCMQGEGFTTINLFIEPGPSSVVNACCAYPSAIGVAGFALRQPRARAVPLSEGFGKPFVEPTIATIRNGAYPMRQRMNIVLLAPSEEKIPGIARDLLRFLLSQDGQEMVVKNGLIPTDPATIPAFLRTH